MSWRVLHSDHCRDRFAESAGRSLPYGACPSLNIYGDAFAVLVHWHAPYINNRQAGACPTKANINELNTFWREPGPGRGWEGP